MSDAAAVKQSPGAIYSAMPAIMAEVGAVEKGRKNTQQGYQFRGVDDVYAAVQLVLAKHGVFVVPRVLSTDWSERTNKSGGTMFHVRALIRHTFYASDGSYVEADTLGEGMDSGDKTSYKAMSGAIKYALLESLCIPTAEPKDPEEESPEVAPKATNGAAKSAPSSGNGAAKSTGPTRARVQNQSTEHKKLLAAVNKLLPGKSRDEVIDWLRFAAGRQDIDSSLSVYVDEVPVIIAKAEAGEMRQ